MRPAPTLSLLVPAFEQPAGVQRILARLQALRGDPRLEVLVADDSRDDTAAACIEAACAGFPQAVYRRNRPPLGAVANWNALLDAACGRYSWLLHHDEEPDSAAMVPALLQRLDAADAPQALLLPCRVVRRPGAAPRLHAPARRVAALLRRWPAYLLRRNLVGPPSALVVRSDRYPRYDPRLAWLVDVEAYVRLLRGVDSIAAFDGGGVLSHVDARHSITAAIGERRRAVEDSERRLLAAAPPAGARLWLSRHPAAALLRAGESVLWTAWRGADRLLATAGARRRAAE